MLRKNLSVLAILCLYLQLIHSQSVKSPAEYIGYDPGTQFTYHHIASEYFKYVADISGRVQYKSYGTTYEGRPLGVCIISDSANLVNLEQIRKNNLVKAGLIDEKTSGRQIPIIWLGYNVHGNEAVGMEASLKVLYTLATDTSSAIVNYLKGMVIIIDPCQNPDGHEMYVSKYRNTMSLLTNPDPAAWEHNQGWPGSRSNHYMFDLNRDWTWQTQKESRLRIALYNQFMPQVHADFHEMGPESTFFFAPGADPWHTVITPWQHEFHKLMGDGNASMFNEKFRLYFTKENFDLFYPSYGDTWPLFNGSIGFTFEQSGGGSSGLAFELESGDTLTLGERIDGHYTAALATLKVSYNNREKLLSEFNKYFEESRSNPSSKYKSVIIKKTTDNETLRDFFRLLDNNQVKYSVAAGSSKKLKGFDYSLNKEAEFSVDKGDILISAYQSQSKFIEVLFEPDSKITDSLSYDLTAWSLPYVFNLKAYATTEKVAADTGIFRIPVYTPKADNKCYAYISPFTGFAEIKLMASLLKKGIKFRYALKPFKMGGKDYSRGSVIITRGDNKASSSEFDAKVIIAAKETKAEVVSVSTGLVESGKDFGSGYSPLISEKKIAILTGEDVSSQQTGELWYYFEQELNYPVTIINLEDISSVSLDKYDILILPSGNFTSHKDVIFNYIKQGGRAIAIESAGAVFVSDKTTSLGKATDLRSTEQKAAEKKEKSDDLALLKKFENERRYTLTERSAGSIYKVTLDDTHPYAFGLGKEWFVMKRSSGYPFLSSGSNIGYILHKEPLAGFAGFKYKEKIINTSVIASENIGKGEVIYLSDDPYYRAFWKSGRILLGNTVFR